MIARSATSASSCAGEGLDVTLAYARDGEEWMALNRKVAGGRTLQYRRAAADLPRGSTP